MSLWRTLFRRKPKEIVIYTQPTCADCRSAKAYFDSRGVPYVEKDVTADPKALEELKGRIGRMLTPTLVYGDEVLLGFAANRERIEAWVRELVEG